MSTMTAQQGEPKILHRAVLTTVSANCYEIRCSPPPPTNMRGNFVTFERKDGERGEHHIIVDSDDKSVRLSSSISTPFDDLSRSVVFWAPGEMKGGRST